MSPNGPRASNAELELDVVLPSASSHKKTPSDHGQATLVASASRQNLEVRPAKKDEASANPVGVKKSLVQMIPDKCPPSQTPFFPLQ